MKQFDFNIPDIAELKASYNNPENYILSEGIVSAVKVAMTLGQPLFLTGEPGTGKTQLAYKIAHHFKLANDEGEYKPFIFNTKTNSTAQDLFYQYDAVRHFRDANLKGGERQETVDYIDLQALGKAIALTNPGAFEGSPLMHDAVGKARHTVVLIDEIDKAPTDFPNDILYEIENMAFEIKEMGVQIKGADNLRPIVIMTSNSEKNLPDAFLRRCVFYHITFPDRKQLMNIVQNHLGAGSDYAHEELIDHFIRVRDVVKKKRPATAELIGWLRMLELEAFLDGDLNFNQLSTTQKEKLRFSYAVLAKNKDDLMLLEKTFCA